MSLACDGRAQVEGRGESMGRKGADTLQLATLLNLVRNLTGVVGREEALFQVDVKGVGRGEIQGKRDARASCVRVERDCLHSSNDFERTSGNHAYERCRGGKK